MTTYEAKVYLQDIQTNYDLDSDARRALDIAIEALDDKLKLRDVIRHFLNTELTKPKW